jgi:hypothetical protein
MSTEESPKATPELLIRAAVELRAESFTLPQLCQATGISRFKALKTLQAMIAEGQLRIESQGRTKRPTVYARTGQQQVTSDR